jgi:endonuclease III
MSRTTRKPDLFDLLAYALVAGQSKVLRRHSATEELEQELANNLRQVIELVRQEQARQRELRAARQALVAARRALEAAAQPIPSELSEAIEQMGAGAAL